MRIQSSNTHNERGPIQTVRVNEQQFTLQFPSDLSRNERVGSDFEALRGSVAAVAETLGAEAPDLSDEGFAKRARALITGKVAGAFQATQATVPAALEALALREAPFMRPAFPADQSPAVRVEQRQYARSLKLPDLMREVEADPTLAAAIIEGGGAMSRLPADVYDRIARQAAVGRAAALLAGQRTFAVAATADDPIGGQPDHAVAREAGEELIAAFEAERETLAGASTVLANVVTMVALMTDMRRDDAFKLLTGDA
jgi:hypothetical protein